MAHAYGKCPLMSWNKCQRGSHAPKRGDGHLKARGNTVCGRLDHVALLPEPKADMARLEHCLDCLRMDLSGLHMDRTRLPRQYGHSRRQSILLNLIRRVRSLLSPEGLTLQGPIIADCGTQLAQHSKRSATLDSAGVFSYVLLPRGLHAQPSDEWYMV